MTSDISNTIMLTTPTSYGNTDLELIIRYNHLYSTVTSLGSETRLQHTNPLFKNVKNPYFHQIFACGAYFHKSCLTPPPLHPPPPPPFLLSPFAPKWCFQSKNVISTTSPPQVGGDQNLKRNFFQTSTSSCENKN